MEDKEPLVIRGKDEMRKWSRKIRSQGRTIRLVPTMGYLHQGHLSLVQQAHKHCHVIVVSIYVNPGQFSPFEDLSTCPSDFHGDIHKLNFAPRGVDVVFCPNNLYEKQMNEILGGVCVSYVEEKGSGHETWIRVERLEKGLCGTTRAVFFRGVATIVTKLFNIVEPNVVVFGKKDYRQWKVIQRMVRDLDFAIVIVGSEIMRDGDGLALSLRNVHLSPIERKNALFISRSLFKAKSVAEEGEVKCSELKDLAILTISQAGGED